MRKILPVVAGATLAQINADDYTQTDTRGVAATGGEYFEYVRQRPEWAAAMVYRSTNVEVD